MIVVDLPRSPVAAKIQWKLRQPTQANRSEFTGVRRVTILAQAPRWSADVEYPSIIGERKFRPWRSALAQLQGQANAFRLIACEQPQLRVHCTVVVDGAGQMGTTLATKGWFPGSGLSDGMFATVNDRLHQVVGDRTAGADGKASLSLMPYLAEGLPDGAPIEVHLPYALMSLTDDSAGWTVGPGQRYEVAFSCEDAF